MKELDPLVFVSVFQEMLGWWFWALTALATLGLGTFAYVIVRDRGVNGRWLFRTQLAGVFSGFVAVFFMWWITNSSIYDTGGPIDVILILAIWFVGLVGGAVLFYGAVTLPTATPIGLDLSPNRGNKDQGRKSGLYG